MRELKLSVAEQRYRAVLAVMGEGRTVTEVAAAVGGVRNGLMGVALPRAKRHDDTGLAVARCETK